MPLDLPTLDVKRLGTYHQTEHLDQIVKECDKLSNRIDEIVKTLCEKHQYDLLHDFIFELSLDLIQLKREVALPQKLTWHKLLTPLKWITSVSAVILPIFLMIGLVIDEFSITKQKDSIKSENSTETDPPNSNLTVSQRAELKSLTFQQVVIVLITVVSFIGGIYTILSKALSDSIDKSSRKAKREKSYEDAWINFYRSVSKTIEKYSQLANTATMISVERDIESTETNLGEWKKQIEETIDRLRDTKSICALLFTRQTLETNESQENTGSDTNHPLHGNHQANRVIEDAESALKDKLLQARSIVLTTANPPSGPTSSVQNTTISATSGNKSATTAKPKAAFDETSPTSSPATPVQNTTIPPPESREQSVPPKPGTAPLTPSASLPAQAKAARTITQKDQDSTITTTDATKQNPKPKAEQPTQETDGRSLTNGQLRRRS